MRLRIPWVTCVLLVGLATLAPGQPPADDAGAQALAAKLVKCAAVKEGDVVWISGGPKDWPLLENLHVEVRKAGAWPVTTTSSERLLRRLYDEVPAKYDGQEPVSDMKLNGLVDVKISLDYMEHNDLLAGVPAERVAARTAAAQPVGELVFRRNVRALYLGNGLLPSPGNAADFGIPQDQLASIYWAGVNTDYDKLQATAQAMSDVFAAGKTVHLTNPNGTDLTVEIGGRPVYSSDGVISADDMKRGGPAVAVYLPAGEVYLTPVSGTAEGRIVADHVFFQGTDIQRLELTFAKGRLTAMHATSGLDALQALYNASGGDKDAFAFLDVGINPDVQIVPGSRMTTWVPAGMVTVGMGGNLWAGGTNSSSFELSPFLPGSTLEVDGKTIVKDGKLVPAA